MTCCPTIPSILPNRFREVLFRNIAVTSSWRHKLPGISMPICLTWLVVQQWQVSFQTDTGKCTFRNIAVTSSWRHKLPGMSMPICLTWLVVQQCQVSFQTDTGKCPFRNITLMSLWHHKLPGMSMLIWSCPFSIVFANNRWFYLFTTTFTISFCKFINGSNI